MTSFSYGGLKMGNPEKSKPTGYGESTSVNNSYSDYNQSGYRNHAAGDNYGQGQNWKSNAKQAQQQSYGEQQHSAWGRPDNTAGQSGGWREQQQNTNQWNASKASRSAMVEAATQQNWNSSTTPVAATVAQS